MESHSLLLLHIIHFQVRHEASCYVLLLSRFVGLLHFVVGHSLHLILRGGRRRILRVPRRHDHVDRWMEMTEENGLIFHRLWMLEIFHLRQER